MLEVVREFTEFFIEESCGWCPPCRVGTTVMLKMLDKIIEGKGSSKDLEELERVCNTVKMMSRCGLGQTAPNPILTTMKNFPKLYSSLIKTEEYVPTFDWGNALSDGIAIAGREPVWEGEEL